jgi:small-conductance mechanosensitive channel
LILLSERSIKPGDVVRVGDTLGVVEDIGIRSMRIKVLDNINLIVPNNRFLSNTVTNYSQGNQLVRIRIPVGVSYDSEPREVEEALLEAAKQPLVLNKPTPTLHFTDFGDNSINFALLVWTNDAINIPSLSSQLRYNIWNVLATRKIEMPPPT